MKLPLVGYMAKCWQVHGEQEASRAGCSPWKGRGLRGHLMREGVTGWQGRVGCVCLSEMGWQCRPTGHLAWNHVEERQKAIWFWGGVPAGVDPSLGSPGFYQKGVSFDSWAACVVKV